MATLKISLSDLPPDAVDVTDLSALPKAELMARLRAIYAFLGPDAEIAFDEGTVTITLPDPSGYQRAEAERAFQSAMKAGERGDNARAIRLLEQVLVTLPAHTSARRNLAMAHLESGDPETAKRLVIETLRLDPKDAWAHLLLGNIYAKHEEDLDRAEACYKRAAELSPRDAFILTNYGALMTERGRTEEADDLFLRAIHEDPTYPNAYYALALHAYNTGDPARATATLENMFEIVKAPTPRTEALFTESRSLYLHACVDLARQRHDELMALVEQRRQELESAGDYPIRLEEDASLQVPATSQMAWKHARDHHMIRYVDRDQSITPHLLMHELEHIAMEQAARDEARNRYFVTTAASREVAVRSIADHIARQKRLGTSEELIEQWTPRSIDVVCAQLSNIPVDMIIEQWLYERYEELHPSQFVSLFAMHSDAARTLNDTQIKEITAPVIYRATVSLNHAFDLFIDRLFGHRTDYATVYRRVPDASAGSKIFAAWQRAMRNYAPGDEFRLVDEVAKLLGLDRWYVWREDVGERDTAEAAGPQGPTNLEALEERDPAVVMYCLDALERFEGMDDAAVFAIGSEIALKAQGGLDYTDPERKHTLQSLKGEQFSGLHLLCLMYVAFQRVNPSLDLQLPFADAYQRALGMFGKRQ